MQPAALMVRVVVTLLAVANAQPVRAQLQDAGHVIRRMSFGTDHNTLNALAIGGAPAIAVYIQDQINEVGTEDPRVPALLTGIVPAATITNLKLQQVVRACFSTFQLREVMTYFWERHFNTWYVTVGLGLVPFGGGIPDATKLEEDENIVFRTHCLGTFYDLLKGSADSLAMMVYLHTAYSIAPVPNEDYARELLELHTVGPEDPSGTPNYTHNDIEQVAACFTGWTLSSGPPFSFQFHATQHIVGPKVMFGSTPGLPTLSLNFPTATVQEAYALLFHLANADATKEFICRKLIRFFLADDANEPTLLAACKTAWGTNGGDIKAVLGTLLNSAEFQGLSYRWRKLEMPIESTVSVVRNYGGNVLQASDLHPILDHTQAMGQELFGHPSPDGYPSHSHKQVGSQLYVDRVRFVTALYRHYPLYPNMIQYDVPNLVSSLMTTYVPAGNLNSPTDVVNLFLSFLLQRHYTPGDLNRLTAFVSTDILGNPAPLDYVNNYPDWANRINLLAVYAQSLPQAQKK